MIEFVRYRLRTRVALNATTSRREYEGALVRYDDGYGCVHPWPELGDGTLEEELNCLRSGKDTRLTRATRRCITLDGEARRAGRWLFEGLEPPLSHATLLEPDLKLVVEAANRGFTMVKVKGSAENLDQLATLIEVSPLPVRIDFNESMILEDLLRWRMRLSEEARRMLDFVEDPCPYDPEAWESLRRETGWNLALDRSSERAEGGFQVLVLKPAVDALDVGETPFIVTSYMDHPLGQLYAAFEAARLAARFPNQILLGGLATHGLFQDLPSVLQLGDGPDLRLPSGTGLGMNDYLNSLSWEPLKA
ncbi:MAG: O-succinylbenzoate synthase [Verrucomicrobiales bacterium]|jgi:O-succinylbenzoate synthase